MRWLAIVALICLTGCIFIEDVERKGFGEEDLVAPQPYNVLLIKKPVANSLFPFSYSYNISWQFSDLYEGYKGAVMVEIENTGRNKIFVYGFGIKIDGKTAREILQEIDNGAYDDQLNAEELSLIHI